MRRYRVLYQSFPYCLIRGSGIRLHQRFRCHSLQGDYLGVVVALGSNGALLLVNTAAAIEYVQELQEIDFHLSAFKILSSEAWIAGEGRAELKAQVLLSKLSEPSFLAWTLLYRAYDANAFAPVLKGTDVYTPGEISAVRPDALWKPGVYKIELRRYCGPTSRLHARQERVIEVPTPKACLWFGKPESTSAPLKL